MNVAINKKWDQRFLKLAQLVAGWSKDPSTKVGAVLVRPDKTILSVGFNGFPAGMEDKSEWLENRDEKYSRMIHAEVNAVLHTLERPERATIYTTLPICDRCAVILLEKGVRNFVSLPLPTSRETAWGMACWRAQLYIEEIEGTWYEIVQGETVERTTFP